MGIGADTKSTYFGWWEGLVLTFWRVSSGRALARKQGNSKEGHDNNKDEDNGDDEDKRDDNDNDNGNSTIEEPVPLFTNTSEQ